MTGGTLGDACRRLRRRLEEGGIDGAAFEARCMIAHAAGFPVGEFPLRAGDSLAGLPPPAPGASSAVRTADGSAFDSSGLLPPGGFESSAALDDMAARRLRGEPLQYILGQWDFLGLTLEVGPGVLIPRPETELLCLLAAEWAGADGRFSSRQPPDARACGPVLLDLCAGSGCVALGAASLIPGARVTAVELAAPALGYLRRNLARYPQYAVEAAEADVLTDAGRFAGPYDAILSNPPYIPSGDLPGLQREVTREPPDALDGGGDGLDFYRAIAAHWIPLLAPGGLCAAEVGAGQAQDVSVLWRGAGLSGVAAREDYAGIGRIVYGVRPREA